MKNNGQQEKQFDAIAICVILSSLEDKIFNHVFACENAKELWKTINENMISFVGHILCALMVLNDSLP